MIFLKMIGLNLSNTESIRKALITEGLFFYSPLDSVADLSMYSLYCPTTLRFSSKIATVAVKLLESFHKAEQRLKNLTLALSRLPCSDTNEKLPLVTCTTAYFIYISSYLYLMPILRGILSKNMLRHKHKSFVLCI